MNYIYDVLLNFQEMPFDFYEWNYSDKITHIRKIPMFKITNNMMFDFLNFDINFSDNITEKIFKKTEIFSKKSVKTLNYSFIVSDGLNSLALLLNNKGKVIKRSKLMLDEDFEVCEFSEHLLQMNFVYKKNCKINKLKFKTRNEKRILVKLLNVLDKIKTDEDQMKYLYYECLNKKSEDVNFIYNSLKSELISNYNLISPKLTKIFNYQQNY